MALRKNIFENDSTDEVESINPEIAEKSKRDSRKLNKEKNSEIVADASEKNDDLDSKFDVFAKNDTSKILTIDVNAEITTQKNKEEIAWHEVVNAYKTRRMLTGTVDGIEKYDGVKDFTVIDYSGYRVVIPLKEMFIDFPNTLHGDEYKHEVIRYQKLLNAMLGAKIDFMVLGVDSKSRSIVASRTEAMKKKRQTFYMETDKDGVYRIYENRIVQARVIAVAEKAVRVEVFGVECSMPAKDLAWDWIGDARERFSVGDEILVRVKEINRDSIKDLKIRVDAKSVDENRPAYNLDLCKIQGKYAGRVTDVHKGIVFIRLNNGVNAIAHSCLDRRIPGKKDDVSFAVTSIDEEREVALGIITRIIKQNI